MTHPADTGLVRGLRRWDLVALVINSVIGAGIFGLPSRVYALAGTYSLFAYVAAAVSVLLIVVCFAEVSSRFNDTGGSYLYAGVAFGPFVGFEVGWLTWLARIAAFAALCNLFVGYLAYFVPASTGPLSRALVIAGLVSVVTFVNLVGLRISAAVTNAFTIGKLIPLLLIVGVGLFVVDLHRYSFATPPAYASFSQAALLLIFTYTGFEGAAIPAGETRDPAQQLPPALLTGIGLVALLYFLIQVVCVGTLPGLAASERPLADAGLRLLGTPGASLVAAGALVSVSGTLNALMFATPRLLFGMAERRQLPRVFHRVDARFHTPAVAILITAGVTLAFALYTTFIAAVTISTVIRLIAYATTCGALTVLRRRTDVPQPKFVSPAGPVVSAIAIALIVWLLSSSTWDEVRLVAIASGLGALLYFTNGNRGLRGLD